MNNNALSTFDFNSNEIRVVTIDNRPWFVAVDLYVLLYGRRTGISSRKILNADETISVKRHAPSASVALGTLFKGTKVSHYALVSESGLYKLVMRSDKPEVRPFQDWITDVVIPAIQKEGAYIMGEEKVAFGEMDEDEFVLKAMTILQGKVDCHKHVKKCAVQTNTVRGRTAAA